MLKTVSAVVAALGQKYDGPTYDREGSGGKMFTYIPVSISINLLDEVFGVFGWTASEPKIAADGGYVHVSVAITARVVDDESGELIEKTVPGVGSSKVNDDNAAKAALGDALSKAVKYFGDAFGRYLSAGKRGGGSSGGGAAPRSSAPAVTNGQVSLAATPFPTSKPEGLGNASKPQVFRLRENGWTDEQIARLDVNTLRAVMDGIFGKDGATKIAPPAAAADDLPF